MSMEWSTPVEPNLTWSTMWKHLTGCVEEAIKAPAMDDAERILAVMHQFRVATPTAFEINLSTAYCVYLLDGVRYVLHGDSLDRLYQNIDAERAARGIDDAELAILRVGRLEEDVRVPDPSVIKLIDASPLEFEGFVVRFFPDRSK